MSIRQMQSLNIAWFKHMWVAPTGKKSPQLSACVADGNGACNVYCIGHCDNGANVDNDDDADDDDDGGNDDDDGSIHLSSTTTWS